MKMKTVAVMALIAGLSSIVCAESLDDVARGAVSNLSDKDIANLNKLSQKPHGKSHGSVYSPAQGVICDKKSGFCADSYGISLGLTKEYLGQKNQDIWTKRTSGNFDTSVFTMSNHVFCDTNIKKCYTNKLKDKVESHWTKALFGN